MDACKATGNLAVWKTFSIYNALRLVNVSDNVTESKQINYKNGIHSDRNLFFFSVREFQPSTVELSITNCLGYMAKGHKFYIFMQPKRLENQKDG